MLLNLNKVSILNLNCHMPDIKIWKPYTEIKTQT